MATAAAPPSSSSNSGPLLSASVTRILSLTGFPRELKTKDVQAALAEWDALAGGFKIKWVDDTSLLLVFNDPTVAKRAYLHTLLNTPPAFVSPNSSLKLIIRPYTGADTQSVIEHVTNRRHNRPSISVPNTHARAQSMADPPRTAWKQQQPQPNSNGVSASMHAPPQQPANGSPTLPNLATQPTLDALIHSSLPDIANQNGNQNPRMVGDPARRMVGAALGMKLGPRVARAEMNEMMGGMVIAE